MKDNKRMGKAMLACRVARGLSQEELGKRLGMTRANVANLESGRFGIMWHHVAALDRLYGGALLKAWRVVR